MKHALTDLLNKYVLVPVDKVICIVAVICQRLSALTLVKELGLERDTSNDTKNTYETCNHIFEKLLIAKHSKFYLCNNFHLSVD